MILGFQDRFVAYVEDGSKTHTIRAGNGWRPGMRADLFARPRRSDMRLIFRAPVLRVEPIVIEEGYRDGDLLVTLAGEPLGLAETDLFFWRDGFRDLTGETHQHTAQAWQFWRWKLPFRGQVIHWGYDRRFNRLADDCFKLAMAQMAVPR